MEEKKKKLSVHEVIVKRILPLLAIPFILTGCARKSDCKLEDDHIHKYTYGDGDKRIVTYIDGEYLKTRSGFNWTEEYKEIHSENEREFYKAKRDLFEGKENWDYLYNHMANSHDYLEFYYYYEDSNYVVTYTDENGNDWGYWDYDVEEGWTRYPTHLGATGKTRVCHPRFYGYKIVPDGNGKYELIKSPLVDDIREIIDEYPYFDNCPTEIVNDMEYDFNRNHLDTLNVSEISEYQGPNLESAELETGAFKH